MHIQTGFLGFLIVFIISSCSLLDERVTPGKLTKLTPNIPRTRFQFTIDNKAYGGISYGFFPTVSDTNLVEYDPQVDQWTRKSPIPIGQRSFGAFSLGSKGYVGGRYPSFQDWWEYTPETDQWTQKKPLPIAGGLPSVVAVEQKGYLLEINQNAKTGNLWQYDPEQDHWLVRSSLPTEAFNTEQTLYPNFFAIGPKAYCFLTTTSYDNCYCSLWEYFPREDKWEQKPTRDSDLPLYSNFLFSLKGKGYFLEIKSTVSGFSTAVIEYNPSKGTFTEKSGDSLRGHSPQKGASFIINGKGYFSVVYRVGSDFWSFEP